MSDKKSEPPLKQCHTIMQGKGGAGKSFVASLICQHYQLSKMAYQAIDLDPVNRTLTAFKGVRAKPWDVMAEGKNLKIDPRRFDLLVEEIIASETDVIIDTGSTSFIPFNEYLIEQDITNLLLASGVETVIHCVLRGSSSLVDTINGLNSLCANHSEDSTRIHVWLNEADGPIAKDGKEFEEMKVFKKWTERIEGVIRIPEQTNELYAGDLKEMLGNNLTFQESINSSNTRIVAKQRLRQMQDEMQSQMASCF